MTLKAATGFSKSCLNYFIPHCLNTMNVLALASPVLRNCNHFSFTFEIHSFALTFLFLNKELFQNIDHKHDCDESAQIKDCPSFTVSSYGKLM